MAAELVEPSQSMDEGQKFSDIVCSFGERADVEKFLAGHHGYAPVFHRARIAAAGGVDGDGVGAHSGNECRIGFGLGLPGHAAEDGEMVGRVTPVGLDGFLAGVEALVAGVFVAFDLLKAVFPRVEDTCLDAVPDNIVFLRHQLSER